MLQLREDAIQVKEHGGHLLVVHAILFEGTNLVQSGGLRQ
jgi:hypothetical protein